MSDCLFHDADPSQLDRKIFEIVQRAYENREKIVIFAQDGDRAAAIDRFLWIMKQEAFIPHEIFASAKVQSQVPVAIVTEELNPIGARTLVADGHCGFDFALTFDVIHEFVNRSTPQRHEACRERFRAYRSRQVAVKHLKMAAGSD
jgi:DNA polymerase IIIc chi subunit